MAAASPPPDDKCDQRDHEASFNVICKLRLCHHCVMCWVRFCRRSNDWQMIIFLLTRYVNDLYLCGNVGSVLLHITQFVLIVSSSETEYVPQLWATFIFYSLSEHKGLDWLQSKYELRRSCSRTFPLTVSVTPSYHFQCLYHCFEFGEKASREKKGSKTTAQGVCRLLDDLRSCYEAVCGFSLGARPWFQPAACCGEAAKPKFMFVCARVPMQTSSVLRGVIDYRCERLHARHTCFESVRNVIFQNEFKEKWLFEMREAGMTPFSTTVYSDSLFFFVGCSQLNPL